MEEQYFKTFLEKYSNSDFIQYKPIYIQKPQIIDKRVENFDRNNYDILEIEDIKHFPYMFNINYENQAELYSIEDDIYEEPELREGKEKSSSIELNKKENILYIEQLKALKDVFYKDNKKFLEDAKTSGRGIGYKLNSRYDFLKFIAGINEKYKSTKSIDMDCKGMKERKFTLMNHQNLVKNYINLKTPYRGLLVYHGLGAGKTCSSISVAEGIKNMNSKIKKKICVLSPAALEKNFREEIKLCGDPIYDKNKYQTPLDFTPKNMDKVLLKAIMNVLGLSKKFIMGTKGGKKAGRVWIPYEEKTTQLSDKDKNDIEIQINKMIENKYEFIHYNGLRKKMLDDRKEKNLFDHKLVIIDEVHNFVSMVFNKINFYSDNDENIDMENSIILYKKLLSAKNCRLVFLTGTPIINKPVELGVLFNMLRGYIREYTFKLTLKKGKKLTEKDFREKLIAHELDDTINYLKYENGILKLTRTRYGFIAKKYDPTGSLSEVIKGKYKNEDVFIKNIIDKVKKLFRNFLSERNSVMINTDRDINDYKALPDNIPDFNNLFLDIKGNDATMKNENYFQKRINGLSSHYESPSVELMPSIIEHDNKETSYPEITNMKIEEIEMSDYQFIHYIKQRKLERQEDINNQKRNGPKNIHEKSNSTYKVYSRMFCNFVFPENILKLNAKERRPRPKDEKNRDKVSFIEKTYNPQETKLLKRGIRSTDKEDHKKMLKEMINALQVNKDKTDVDDNKTSLDYLNDENLKTYSPKFLKTYTNILSADNDGGNLVYSSFRNGEGIEIFSRGLETRGFTMFEIEKENSNSGSRFKTRDWVLSEDTKNKLDIINSGNHDDITLESHPFFIVYSGTETEEKKELLRLIYNGDWDKIPSNAKSIKKYLIKHFYKYIDKENNEFYGKFIKLFMITSSGAEGISLKNTRYVHILEPYWGPVRIDQVIGRARRICSHDNLPEEKRTVSVHLYLMKLSDIQKNWGEGDEDVEKNKEIQDIRELVKYDREKTSDQSMWDLSQKKKNINNQFLELIKGSAIDCLIHNTKDKCNIEHPVHAGNYIYGNPKIVNNKDIDKHNKMNVRGVKKKKIYFDDKKRKKYFVLLLKEYEKVKDTVLYLTNSKGEKVLNWEYAVGKEVFDRKGRYGIITKNEKNGAIKLKKYKKQ